MNAERKIARELAEKTADDRAHRIASMAAEELIRCECEATSGIDEFAIPQCQADDHMRDCIAHLCWHGQCAECAGCRKRGRTNSARRLWITTVRREVVALGTMCLYDPPMPAIPARRKGEAK